jgi:hypothetical protein
MNSKLKVIANSGNEAALEDERLSWEALGVLCYLSSKSDNWQFNAKDIMRSGKSGRDQVRRILKELMQAGYLARGIVRDERGRVSGGKYKTIFKAGVRAPGHLPESEGGIK